MPSYFFDSSSIIKRYHPEEGSPWVLSVCEAHPSPVIYLSQLAEVEVIAAIRRKGRGEGLHQSYMDALINMFERHLVLSTPERRSPIYRMIPLTSATTSLAANLCNRYWNVDPFPLRSLDALQLASALVAMSRDVGTVQFVTSDRRLAAVVPLVGMNVIDPAHP